MTKALELAKFGRESAPSGAVVGDSDTQTLSAKTFSDMPVLSAGTVNTVPYLNASKVLTTTSDLTFNGTTLGVSGNVNAAGMTLSGGTANGVAYLNGSKVVTSGSNLTFDGTSLTNTGNTRVTSLKAVGRVYSTSDSSYDDLGSTKAIIMSYDAVNNIGYLSARDYTASANVPIFISGSDVRFGTGGPGTETVRVTTAGLGIGTTSPDRPVHLSSNGTRNYFKAETTTNSLSNEAGFEVKTPSSNFLIGSHGSTNALWIYDINGAAERLRIGGDGRVSIGTANLDEKLTVAGNIRLYGNQAIVFQQVSGVAVGAISFRNSSGVQKAAIGSYYNIADEGAIEFIGPTSSTTQMILRSNGTLVIGDTTSQYSSKLYVNGAIAARHGGVDGTYQPAFIAGYTSNYTEANVISTAVSSAAGGSGFQFEVSNGAGSAGRTSTVLFKRNQAQFNTPVYVGGQLSIGGNSLYFEKSGTRSWQLYANQSTGAAFLQSGDGAGTLVIDTGYVGIGTDSPYAKLHVNGGLYVSGASTQGRFITNTWTDLLGGHYRGYGSSNVARYEIMRIAIDYNDWNSVGSAIIELSQNYYSTGGYSKWSVNYGYVQNHSVTLMEAQADWKGASVSIGSPVQVSGDHYYIPVYVLVQGYHQFSGRLTSTHTLSASTVPGAGNAYIFASPNLSNPGTTSITFPEYLIQRHNQLIDGKLATSNYAVEHQLNGGTFVQKRAGRMFSMQTYTLFTRGNADAQSSGKVYVQAIYGTPASAGTWEYCITGDKRVSLTSSNTTNYSGGTPSVYWSGNSLILNNQNGSVYCSAIVELHNIGGGWEASWGDMPGIVG